MRWILILVAILAGCEAPDAPRVSARGSRTGGRVQGEWGKPRTGEDLPKWVVGATCGIGNGLAEGRAEVQNYIERDREDALRQLLRDKEPAARVYGAIGLHQVGATTDEEFRTEIAAIAGRVDVCRGCIYSKVTPAEAVSYY